MTIRKQRIHAFMQQEMLHLGPQFVYVAAYQGGVAAGNAIGGLNKKLNLEVVPGVTFNALAIATVGLTEQQAKEKGYEVKTSVLPLDAVPRALVNRETTGVFKLVADAKTLKVLGAHVVAENAGDVIYAATLAVKFGLTVEDLRRNHGSIFNNGRRIEVGCSYV